MAQKKTLVVGASGRTGRPVVQALARAGATVRAFLRQEAHVPDLRALGAEEIAMGDLSDPESLMKAAETCDVVVYIGPPMDPDEVKRTQSALKAARAGGVSHFVYYSVMHPLRREVRHHRLKLDAEEAVIESGLPYTIVQPCRYMQHLEPIWKEVTEQGVHAMPFGVDKRFNIVDLMDLAEATATVVAQGDRHHWATYELAGPQSLSMRDVAAILSKAIDRPVEARAISLQDLATAGKAKGFSEDRIEQMRAMNHHYDEYGFLGNSNVLGWLLGRAPGDFDAYVQRLMAKAT